MANITIDGISMSASPQYEQSTGFFKIDVPCLPTQLKADKLCPSDLLLLRDYKAKYLQGVPVLKRKGSADLFHENHRIPSGQLALSFAR